MYLRSHTEYKHYKKKYYSDDVHFSFRLCKYMTITEKTNKFFQCIEANN